MDLIRRIAEGTYSTQVIRALLLQEATGNEPPILSGSICNIVYNLTTSAVLLPESEKEYYVVTYEVTKNIVKYFLNKH